MLPGVLPKTSLCKGWVTIMDDKKPKGYFKYLLAVDCETTGIAFNSDDASHDKKTGDTFQSVSWGVIVVNADTLQEVESLYLEIKWDGKSKWTSGAEQVHGLSKQHLAEQGVSSEEAVVEIGSLIFKYWGSESPVSLVGHNVATFDLAFLKRLMRSEGIELRFSNRHLDTNGIGFAAFSTYNSDDLFEQVGCDMRDPGKHNALDDARMSLRVVQTTRTLFNKCIDGE